MASKRRTVIAIGLLGGVGLLALGLWLWREPIAREAIDSNLSDRNIPASYEIEHLGTQRQRLKNVRLGTAERPDLTAEWAEIETGYSLSGVTVKTIRAGGVRLYGQYSGGTLTLGSIDRLLPAPDGTPFQLPDMDVSLNDARLSLKTDAGPVGVALTGQGRLTDGFAGQIALASRGLRVAGCGGKDISAQGTVRIDSRRPEFSGPVRIAQMQCAGVTLNALKSALNVETDESLKHAALDAPFNSGVFSFGAFAARSGSGRVQFNGGLKGFKSNFQVALETLRTPAGIASTAKFDGAASGNSRSGLSISGGGLTSLSGFIPDKSVQQRVLRSAPGGGTPVEPLITALQRAVSGLNQGSDVNASLRFSHAKGTGQLSLDSLAGKSKSGARFAMRGKDSARFVWPDSRLSMNATMELSGGGFPQISVRLKGSSDTVTGVATMAPWVQNDARLALSPAAFAYRNGRLSLDTIAQLDGPVGTGRITGLTVPVSLRPGQTAFAGCITPRFDRLQLDSLSLQNGLLRACIGNGVATLPALRMAGRLGSTPLTLAASGARIGLANGDFSSTGVAIRLGEGDAGSRLDAGRLSGKLGNGGASGQFSGLSGKIGAVPLLLDQGGGRWSLNGGNLAASAQIQVSDAEPDYRFRPLFSPDFKLTLRNGVINGEGTLRNALRDVDVARVFLEHRLARGTGQAVIDMPGISFGSRVQPEELTPITLGVIANVEGTLTGQGLIQWTADGVQSSGSFGTDKMDMAAAFGPVSGLSGRIELSDLLGLETGPGQQVRIAGINPGIAVLDGLISYRLLPGLKVHIEGGTWPFAGGLLKLDPTILDLNQSAERRLTFRVEGADAARFIAAMEFENIAATGIFDGELPIVFDRDGGRIESGFLVARGSGTVSYVGEISNENVGAMGRFAFDALKSIRYNRLRIDLEGAIDGDVVTRISFAGLNQAPIQGVRAKFPIPVKVTGLTNIPFIFNITITAKFRQLFEMARSFNDPSTLINRMIPNLEPVPGEKARSVQPPERPPIL